MSEARGSETTPTAREQVARQERIATFQQAKQEKIVPLFISAVGTRLSSPTGAENQNLFPPLRAAKALANQENATVAQKRIALEAIYGRTTGGLNLLKTLTDDEVNEEASSFDDTATRELFLAEYLTRFQREQKTQGELMKLCRSDRVDRGQIVTLALDAARRRTETQRELMRTLRHRLELRSTDEAYTQITRAAIEQNKPQSETMTPEAQAQRRQDQKEEVQIAVISRILGQQAPQPGNPERSTWLKDRLNVSQWISQDQLQLVVEGKIALAHGKERLLAAAKSANVEAVAQAVNDVRFLEMQGFVNDRYQDVAILAAQRNDELHQLFSARNQLVIEATRTGLNLSVTTASRPLERIAKIIATYPQQAQAELSAGLHAAQRSMAELAQRPFNYIGRLAGRVSDWATELVKAPLDNGAAVARRLTERLSDFSQMMQESQQQEKQPIHTKSSITSLRSYQQGAEFRYVVAGLDPEHLKELAKLGLSVAVDTPTNSEGLQALVEMLEQHLQQQRRSQEAQPVIPATEIIENPAVMPTGPETMENADEKEKERQIFAEFKNMYEAGVYALDHQRERYPGAPQWQKETDEALKILNKFADNQIILEQRGLEAALTMDSGIILKDGTHVRRPIPISRNMIRALQKQLPGENNNERKAWLIRTIKVLSKSSSNLLQAIEPNEQETFIQQEMASGKFRLNEKLYKEGKDELQILTDSQKLQLRKEAVKRLKELKVLNIAKLKEVLQEERREPQPAMIPAAAA